MKPKERTSNKFGNCGCDSSALAAVICMSHFMPTPNAVLQLAG